MFVTALQKAEWVLYTHTHIHARKHKHTTTLFYKKLECFKNAFMTKFQIKLYGIYINSSFLLHFKVK